MKILQVISSMGKGGAERYVADICIELNKRNGIEVMLIAMSPVNHYEFLTNIINYQVTDSKVLPSITGKSLINTDHYQSIVNEFKPDIIHSHLFHTELLTRQNIDSHITYVTTCQNNMPEFSNFSLNSITKKIKIAHYFEKKWMIAKYRECQNNFITISKDTERYYKSVLPNDLNSIHLLYHAINFSRFNKVNHKRDFKDKKIKLIYVARFVPIKNQSFLVDITKRIKELGYDVEAILIGDGETKEMVFEKVKLNKLENEVKLIGLVDHVEDFMKDANIYVHPATYEPFGLVIIEAMAAGLPVICLNGKGNRDLIIDDYNGFMFDNEDVDIFSQKIISLFNNRIEYDRISENAVEYASRYRIEKHVDNLLTLYKMFIEKRRT
jgi:glycosyltransferase involved in cell wall biosynthesis